jgi:hypothetical protein
VCFPHCVHLPNLARVKSRVITGICERTFRFESRPTCNTKSNVWVLRGPIKYIISNSQRSYSSVWRTSWAPGGFYLAWHCPVTARLHLERDWFYIDQYSIDYICANRHSGFSHEIWIFTCFSRWLMNQKRHPMLRVVPVVSFGECTLYHPLWRDCVRGRQNLKLSFVRSKPRISNANTPKIAQLHHVSTPSFISSNLTNYSYNGISQNPEFPTRTRPR